jgi:hypothetical protein
MRARDLWLSPDHAVFANGVLIPVKFLINRTSIAQAPRDDVTYYHIQVTRHDVLLAEGLPVESYLGNGHRGEFASNGRTMAMHPGVSARAWELAGCAELVQSGKILYEARSLLEERSGRADGSRKMEAVC